MRSTEYFKVAIHWILIITSTQGYNYERSSVSGQMDTVSESEINLVIHNRYERERLRLSVDQVHSERPQNVPPCLYDGHVYDATAEVCAAPNMQAHCREGMTFLPVPNSEDLGACACDSLDQCLGRPQFLTQDGQCYGIATRGRCNNGETLVPISKFSAKCGPDVCLHSRPENAINFTEESKKYPGFYPAFNFTYLGKCYTTESQAFCPRGQVVRFIVPFKIPVCVDPKNLCTATAAAAGYQFNTLRGCGPGLKAIPSRGICQRISVVDI